MRWDSYKRINAVFHNELPDRVPKYEGSIEIKELNPVFDGQVATSALLFFSPSQVSIFHRFPFFISFLKKVIDHPSFFYPIARYAPRIISKLPRQFNYDMFAYTPGIPMVFNENIFNDFHTDSERKIIYDQQNRLIWRNSPDGAHTRHGFMRSKEDWEKYMAFQPDHRGNFFLQQGALKTCKKLDIVPLLAVWGAAGFEELSSMFGFETLFKFLIKDKEFIKKAVKQLNNYAIATVEQVLERGGDYIYITADLGYKGRSIISPRMFKEFFKPGIKRFCRKVHQYGGKVIFHSCGYVEELLPDLVDAGIDALHPIEKAAGNDIVKLQKQYENQLVLIGNVPIPLLTHGTPRQNYEYVRDLINDVSINGGHIISSSHSVTQWCKLKNFYAYYKAVEDFGKLSQK